MMLYAASEILADELPSCGLRAASSRRRRRCPGPLALPLPVEVEQVRRLERLSPSPRGSDSASGRATASTSIWPAPAGHRRSSFRGDAGLGQEGAGYSVDQREEAGWIGDLLGLWPTCRRMPRRGIAALCCASLDRDVVVIVLASAGRWRVMNWAACIRWWVLDLGLVAAVASARLTAAYDGHRWIRRSGIGEPGGQAGGLGAS